MIDNLTPFLVQWAVTSLALWVASHVFRGIRFADTSSLVISALMTVILLGAGLAIGLGVPDAATVAGLGRQFALGVLTAAIAVPAGWASSLGRGLLPGIAASVGILVLAQVAVLADFASWVPFVAPAFWALQPASSALPLLVVPVIPILFGAATVTTWRRLQLDR